MDLSVRGRGRLWRWTSLEDVDGSGGVRGRLWRTLAAGYAVHHSKLHLCMFDGLIKSTDRCGARRGSKPEHESDAVPAPTQDLPHITLSPQGGAEVAPATPVMPGFQEMEPFSTL